MNVTLDYTIDKILRRVYRELSLKMTSWKRYVDDTISYFETDTIDYILSVLNSVYTKVRFTYEIEDSREIAFLNVLRVRMRDDIKTTVY